MIHQDIKPQNIVIGLGENTSILHLIDFGVSQFYKSMAGTHISETYLGDLTGTLRYASLNSHLGI